MYPEFVSLLQRIADTTHVKAIVMTCGVARVLGKVLVDSVINNGKSVIEFVKHIRKIDAYIRIIVVTGVVQAKSVSLEHGGAVAKLLEEDPNVNVVALRMSDNKYTGKGGTDTGHRLFNTTYLD